MDPELRRENEKAIMRRYYETLKTKFGEDTPFTYDVLVKSYYRLMKANFSGAFGVFFVLLKANPEAIGGEKYKNSILKRCKSLAEDTLVSIGKN